jgi:hypothetical protein
MSRQADSAKVVERAKDLYAASRKLARKGSSKVRSFIHAMPVLTVLLALGTGCILARIFRPRK